MDSHGKISWNKDKNKIDRILDLGENQVRRHSAPYFMLQGASLQMSAPCHSTTVILRG